MIQLRPGLKIDQKCIKMIEHQHSEHNSFYGDDGKPCGDVVHIYFEIGQSCCQRSMYFNDQDEAHALVRKLEKARK